MVGMEEFKIVFNVEVSEKRKHRPVFSSAMQFVTKPVSTIRDGVAAEGEDKFWEEFRARGAEGYISRDIALLHARIREHFPDALRQKLVPRLMRDFMPRYSRARDRPRRRDTEQERDRDEEDRRAWERERFEFEHQIESLEIQVKRIGSGSLELIVLVLGFTKLAEIAGIDRDDFAKYLEIFAPGALNESFNANVPLVADATTAAAVIPSERQSGTIEPRGSPGSLYAAFYLVPAIFAVGTAAAVLWVASSTISGITTSLVDERKMITANLQEETKAVAAERSKLIGDFLDAQKKNQDETADERKAVNEQLAAFALRLTETNQKRDEVLDQAHKALFDAQMAFIGQATAGSKDRDTAVVEFVKGHLAGTNELTPPFRFPGPAVENDHGPPQPYYVCNLNRDGMGRLQRALLDQSLFSGRIDGLYGRITGDALQRYQLKENLPVTRQPDKATLDKLGLICNPVPFPSTTRADLAH